MTKFRSVLSGLLAVIILSLAAWAASSDTPLIRVGVGDSKVVRFPGGISRVAVGTAGLVTVTVTGHDELMLNGTAAGVTTLHVWNDNREVKQFSLQVLTRPQMFASDAAKIAGVYDAAVQQQPDNTWLVRGFVRDAATRAKVMNLARVYFSEVTDGLLLPGEEAPLLAQLVEGRLTQSDTTVITKLFTPRSRSASDLNTVLSSMLSEDGRIIVDASTNSLIVIDTPENIETIGRFITRLDEQTTAQVMIEAKFVELTEAATEELGLDWNLGYASFRNTTVTGQTNPLDPSTSHTAGGITMLLDAATGNLKDLAITNLAGTLRALEKQGKLNLLSAPRVTTVNGQAASVEITSSQAYISGYTYTYDDNGQITSGTPTISTVETGISLSVTPTIGKDDIITMQVQPTVSILADLASAGNAQYPVQLPLINKRTTNVTVMLRDGGTLVIAGLMQDQSQQGNDHVPLLGRIPLFGRLFSHDRQYSDKSNITVFITANIIKYDRNGGAATAGN